MPSNTYGRQVVVALTNKSGGGVIAGDVVIVGTANNDAFTTTNSAAATGTVGIAQETIADNATGRVLLAGYAALVNTTASVTRQNYGTTSTTVKKAVDAGSSRTTGTFCQFLTGGTTPDALVWQPDLGAGTSVPPNCYQSIMTAPVTIVNANQFYDAVSITPAAGDYLVTFEVDILGTHASGTNHTARIIHNSVVQKARNCLSGSGGGNASSLSVTVRMTADGSNTIIGQGAANRGSSDSTILDTANVNGTTDKCTSITAVRITSV